MWVGYVKNKYGQISSFVIIGAVIVVILAGFLASRIDTQKTEMNYNAQNVFSIGPKQSSLNSFVHDCVKETLIQAELEYGLHIVHSKLPITNYMLNNLPGCFNNFETFKEQGFKIQKGNLEASVDITRDSVVVNVNYPLTITKGAVILNIEDQTYRFPRTVMETINPDGWTRVISADGSMILEIPPGTKAMLPPIP